MEEFLDRGYGAYQESGERVPVGGPPGGPARDIDDFLFNLKIGIRQFGGEAFAVLIHPDTKFEMQNWWMEQTGGMTFENIENLPDQFEGCLLQSAFFIKEMRYLVIGKADHEKLIEEHPNLV